MGDDFSALFQLLAALVNVYRSVGFFLLSTTSSNFFNLTFPSSDDSGFILNTIQKPHPNKNYTRNPCHKQQDSNEGEKSMLWLVFNLLFCQNL